MFNINTPIKDCCIIEVDRHHDIRGFFQELFRETAYNFEVNQISQSFSLRGTIRGIHISPYPKLVTCISGHIFDVCVDIRENSPSYGQWFGYNLKPDGHQFYCPAFCGHGFLAIEDSEVVYSQGGMFTESLDRSLHWQDSTVGIEWPKMEEYLVSERDKTAPSLKCLLSADR